MNRLKTLNRFALSVCAALLCLPDAIASAAKAHDSFIDLPSAKLWVVDTGGRGEPIILLHPHTGHSAIWEHQIAAFAAAGYRVIAPDKPGTGKSLNLDSTKPINYADTLDALVNHLKLRKFILLGAAEGGYFAFDYAASKSQRVHKLILVASGLGVQVDEEGRAFRRNSAIPNFSALPPEVRELSPSYRGLNPEGVQRWLEIEHQSTASDAARPLLRSPNTTDKLSSLRMPVLVIAGDVDLTTPSGAIRLWAKHIRNHQFVLIPEAGHAVMWEQPKAFNDAVLSFINHKN
jgi:pimeloyl-ACP methyl ester carboxylesterase